MKIFIKRHNLVAYLSTKLLATIFGTALLLTTIMEALVLLDQLNSILERHLGTIGVLHYMMLRLPMLFSSILPLSTLIGSLIALTQLTLNNEITTLRSAGLSTFDLFIKLLPVPLILSGLCFIFYDQITPKTELDLAVWWNKSDPNPQKGKEFYFYQNFDIISIGYLAYGGNKIVDLNIYKRKNFSHLESILTAKEANYCHRKWILSDAKILNLDHSLNLNFKKITINQPLIWQTNLTPKILVRLSSVNIPQSLHTISHQLFNRYPLRTPTNSLKTKIWQRFFLPFTFIIMIIISLPVTFIPPRAGLKSWLPIYCLSCGLFFIIFQEVLNALGKAGTLPPPMAVIPSILIFLLAASAIILTIEEKP